MHLSVNFGVNGLHIEFAVPSAEKSEVYFQLHSQKDAGPRLHQEKEEETLL